MDQSTSDLPRIPDELAPYAAEIEATVRDSVSLKLKPSDSLKLWQSKVGGEPYLPLGTEYPCNPNGTPLALLAQINFAEMPSMPDYPDKGILEFYIDVDEPDAGVDMEHPTEQRDFRVLYFDEAHEDESRLRRDTRKYQERPEFFPLQDDRDYSIEFTLEKKYITCSDYRFETMPFSDNGGLVDGGLDHLFNETFSKFGHRIGGYPDFMQADPREYSEELRGYELLFQLNSEWGVGPDDDVNIMWGDAGVAGFFIRPEDLKKRVFTDIFYTWDCC